MDASSLSAKCLSGLEARANLSLYFTIMHHAPIIPLVLFLAFTTTSPGKAATQHAWRVQQLHKDNNEGIAVGDINGDGQMDITSGEFWYQAPDFKQQPLRKILPFGADYMQNNSEHLYDMDGDGDLDVLSGAFTLKNVDWFENPGEGNYAKGLWSVHQLVDTGTGYNEATFLHDIDGDGTPEFIENSWNPKNPMQIFRLVRAEDGSVSASKHVVSKSGNGHGMGFGDLNGDGRQDIVFQSGWYEQPSSGPFSGTWEYHHDFDLPHASCPILIIDLNDDGRNDLIWSDGHSYGLYWQEQLIPQPDGTITWRQHLIDKSFSQGHSLAWMMLTMMVTMNSSLENGITLTPAMMRAPMMT